MIVTFYNITFFITTYTPTCYQRHPSPTTTHTSLFTLFILTIISFSATLISTSTQLISQHPLLHSCSIIQPITIHTPHLLPTTILLLQPTPLCHANPCSLAIHLSPKPLIPPIPQPSKPNLFSPKPHYPPILTCVNLIC